RELTARAGGRGVAVLYSREAAQGRADRRARGAYQVHVGEVHVIESDDAAVTEVAGRCDLLGHRADQVLRRDHRRIVGAGDRDIDLPGDEATILVVQRDGEALHLGLARGQVLDGRVGDRVRPRELTACAASGRI